MNTFFQPGDFITYEISCFDRHSDIPFSDDLEWGYGIILHPGSYVPNAKNNLIESGWYYSVLKLRPYSLDEDGTEWIRQDCLDSASPLDNCCAYECEEQGQDCFLTKQMERLENLYGVHSAALPQVPPWELPSRRILNPQIEIGRKAIQPNIQIVRKVIQPNIRMGCHRAIATPNITIGLPPGSDRLRLPGSG